MSNSESDLEFKALYRQLEIETNDNFMNYFEKFLKIKEKWVFYKMNNIQKKCRTNMAIESWHKTLKYYYFQGNQNRRVDLLLNVLLKMDNDKQYQIELSNKKGRKNTVNTKINERHNYCLKAKMNIINNKKIQVFFLKIVNLQRL